MRLFPLLALLAAGCTKDEPAPDVVDEDEDGYAATEDCNDGAPSIHPGATELCDGLDQDCDGSTADEPTTVFFADADLDGFGDPGATVSACEEGQGVVANGADCDDGDGDVHPDEEETCDGVDSNCSGDENDATDAASYFLDEDLDGFGTVARVKRCELAEGLSTVSGDCDDGADTVFPGADEVCNGADDDCDREIDEAGAAGGADWYPDADGDGYGVPGEPISGCDAPDGYGKGQEDCDDADASVNPGATETCDDEDDDCDGAVDDDAIDGSTWYDDGDGDGFGDTSTGTVACAGVGVTASGDCDDADGTAFPGAAESCDGDDDDCDGATDEDAADEPAWYADVDGDGFGDPVDRLDACTQPSGYVSDASDCDDADDSVFPGAPETCDGVDDDCDGDIDPAFLDADFEGGSPLAHNGSAAWMSSGPDDYLRLVSGASAAGTAWHGVVPGTRFLASFSFEASGGAGGKGVALAFLDSTDTAALGTGDVYGVGGLTGYAVAFDTANDRVLAVDASTGSTLASASAGTLLDTGWHDVEIVFDAGALDVSLDGTGVLSTTIAGYALTEQLIGVSAGTTSTQTADHDVDDLVLGCP
jgi:hypothetical protein